jgi:hypothetical protein
MNIGLITSASYIKQFTGVHANVNDDVLNVSINLAQDLYIQPALGTDLYDKIRNDTVSGTLSGDYETLADTYVRPALAWFTVYEAAREVNFKFMNKSIASSSSDNSQPVDWQTLQNLREEYRDKAEFYLKRLNDYLCEYSDTYPEYTQNTTADKMVANAKSYSSPIYLKRHTSSKPRYKW